MSAESGTGLVHSAPGHGHEDYQSFLRAGISLDKLRSPVNDDGCFVAAMDWLDPKISHSLEGKEVLGKGNDAVVELMRDAGYLLAEEKIKHKYPYDWKSKTPTIIRLVNSSTQILYLNLLPVTEPLPNGSQMSNRSNSLV